MVISGVISRVPILITHIRGLITPLITTHEPPSRVYPRLPNLKLYLDPQRAYSCEGVYSKIIVKNPKTVGFMDFK